MSLFSSDKKEKDQETEDIIKILSTNMEVLNQKLTLNSSGSSDDLPKLEHNLQEISKKIDFTVNCMNSLQENLQKHFSYNDAKFNVIDKDVKTVQSQINEHIDEKQEELKKDINQGLINLLSEISNQILRNNKNIVNTFNHFNQFKENLPKNFSNLDAKIAQIQNNMNNNFKNFSLSNKNQRLPNQSNIPQDLMNDIKFIRNELEEKFTHITTQLYPLLKINKELLEFLKKDEFQISNQEEQKSKILNTSQNKI
jgi:predicted  nucleic acid-binding Zn-ribbon protein